MTARERFENEWTVKSQPVVWSVFVWTKKVAKKYFYKFDKIATITYDPQKGKQENAFARLTINKNK